jgi:hypothetical protein
MEERRRRWREREVHGGGIRTLPPASVEDDAKAD